MKNHLFLTQHALPARGYKIEEEMYERKQSGIYFTPEFLVNHIVENTLGKKLAKCKTPAEALSITET